MLCDKAGDVNVHDCRIRFFLVFKPYRNTWILLSFQDGSDPSKYDLILTVTFVIDSSVDFFTPKIPV